MTAQLHDSLLYENQEYSIIGVNGQGLFQPMDYGLNPLGLCSACWRGFLCQYFLKDRRLYLNWLRINCGHAPQKAPVVNGVYPEYPPEDYPIFDTYYKNLILEIMFSGGMLLGTGFIHELYVHIDFHPAWKFETVYELIFQKGVVEEIRDVREKVAEIRNWILKKSLDQENINDNETLMNWIQSTFRLDYRL